MGTAHVGDEAVVGTAHAHEFFDVVGVVRAHFDDGDFGVWGDAEEAQGHANVVVEIAFGGRDPVFAGEHCGYEFLGRGLAVGAGEADDGELAAAHVGAVPDGEVAKGRLGVGDADEAGIVARCLCVL